MQQIRSIRTFNMINHSTYVWCYLCLCGAHIVVLQMIAFEPSPVASASSRSVFKQASEWAADTLLDLNRPQTQLLMNSRPLQTLPNALVSSHTRSVLLRNLHEMALVLQDAQLEPVALTATLEHAALHLDEASLFLELTEQLIAGHEVFTLGTEAVRRLCGPQRLLHALSMASRVRVWANQVPLWTAQVGSSLSLSLSVLRPVVCAHVRCSAAGRLAA